MDTITGMTTLACEIKLIDHAQGDQYLYVRVETEVPTVAGDWSNRAEAVDVFGSFVEHFEDPAPPFSRDEGVLYYRDGELLV